MKVWAKTILEEKITRDVIYEYSTMENEEEFISTLQEVCGQMDIPTPVATNVNFVHYTMFNNTRFKARDFVEYIDFDVLELEAIPEKEKQR